MQLVPLYSLVRTCMTTLSSKIVNRCKREMAEICVKAVMVGPGLEELGLCTAVVYSCCIQLLYTAVVYSCCIQLSYTAVVQLLYTAVVQLLYTAVAFVS
jgi:hypothetical protein